MPIIYKMNIMEALKERGYSSYKLRHDKIFGEAVMTKFRQNNTNITVSQMETLCKLLDCQPGDILEYVTTNEWLNTP